MNISRHQFQSRPRVVSQSSRNRRRLFVRRMNTAEVEVCGEQNHRPAVVFNRAAESHCLASEPAIKQPHRKVCALALLFIYARNLAERMGQPLSKTNKLNINKLRR